MAKRTLSQNNKPLKKKTKKQKKLVTILENCCWVQILICKTHQFSLLSFIFLSKKIEQLWTMIHEKITVKKNEKKGYKIAEDKWRMKKNSEVVNDGYNLRKSAAILKVDNLCNNNQHYNNKDYANYKYR